MTYTSQPEIDRVRSLYLDFHDEGPYPRRGDELSYGNTLYLILAARQVKRRAPNSCVRIQMRVIRAQDAPEGLMNRLYRSALRGRGMSMRFNFTWYKRVKKRKTFEEYIGGNPSVANKTYKAFSLKTEIKVYAVNEAEYVAASSELESALEYARCTAHSVERCVEEGYIDMKKGYPRQLSDKEMLKTMFNDEDDQDFGKSNITFKQQLENLITSGVKFPRYFAGEL